MALDKVFVSVKVGDNGEYIDGMPVDLFDERDKGLPFEKVISPYCAKVFRFVQIDRKMKPYIEQMLAPSGFSKVLGPMGEPLPDATKYRIRSGVIPLADLAAFSGKSESLIRDQTMPSAPINGLLMPESIFKPAQLFAPDGKMLDMLSVAQGSFTIGDLMDYATWALFGADIAATLTGALTGTQQTATAETAQSVINKALAGYALTLTSAVNPLGNFGAGYLSTFSQATAGIGQFQITCSSASGGASIVMANLNLKYVGASSGSANYLIYLLTNTGNITPTIKDSLFNCNNLNVQAWRINGTGCILQAHNCVMANGAATGGKYCCGIVLISCNVAAIFENLTVYNFTGAAAANGSGVRNYINRAIAFTNLACFASTQDYSYGTSDTAGLGDGVASKCASSDTSGSEAGLRSLTAANEFISTDITNAQFLRLRRSGTIAHNGTTPSIAANTYGIAGNARPHSEKFSIGAFELPSHRR